MNKQNGNEQTKWQLVVFQSMVTAFRGMMNNSDKKMCEYQIK